MLRPSTSFLRAVRWQQPLTIIVVLSGMLTASTPAAPDTDCMEFEDLLEAAGPAGPVVQNVGNNEKIVRLGAGWSGREVTLCSPAPDDPPVKRVRFKVRDSNVLLDCGGMVFDGSPGPVGTAVSWAMDFDTSVSPAIHDVVVRNCEFHGYKEGIKVQGTGVDGPTEKGLANITLQNIVLRDIGAFSETGGGAVKIGAHNRDNLLEGVDIIGAEMYGVYLEAHSSRTTIRDCKFINNGWSVANAAADGREAIAIDASSDNVITDSYFYNNKYAGITLYKNCGEGGKPRDAMANYNIIERNKFYRHDNTSNRVEDGVTRPRGAAIVIASRQGLDLTDTKDAFGADGTCTDDPIPEAGNRYRDYARYNVVRRNAFAFNTTSILVRDSFNHIEGNTFMGETWENPDAGELEPEDGETEPEDGETEPEELATAQAQYDVLVDAKLLEDIDEPAAGITVIDNVTLTSTASGRTFESLYEATTVFANNVDRSYQCVPDSLALGNRCSGNFVEEHLVGGDPNFALMARAPRNRCEVRGPCPARAEYAGFPDFPDYWLATVYGANILPDVCGARAQKIWEWCAVDGGGAFTVTTTAVVDGDEVATESYSGPTEP